MDPDRPATSPTHASEGVDARVSLFTSDGPAATPKSDGSALSVSESVVRVEVSQLQPACIDSVTFNGNRAPVADGKAIEYEFFKGTDQLALAYFCGDQLVGSDLLPIAAPEDLKLVGLEAFATEPLVGAPMFASCIGTFVDGYALPLDGADVLPTVSGPVQATGDPLVYQPIAPGDIDVSCSYAGQVHTTRWSVPDTTTVSAIAEADGETGSITVETGQAVEIGCSRVDSAGDEWGAGGLYPSTSGAAQAWLHGNSFRPAEPGTYEVICDDHLGGSGVQEPVVVEVVAREHEAASWGLDENADGTFTVRFELVNTTTGDATPADGSYIMWKRATPTSPWEPAPELGGGPISGSVVVDPGSVHVVGVGDEEGPEVAKTVKPASGDQVRCLLHEALARDRGNGLVFPSTEHLSGTDEISVRVWRPGNAEPTSVAHEVLNHPDFTFVDPDRFNGLPTIAWETDASDSTSRTPGWAVSEVQIRPSGDSSGRRERRFVCSQEIGHNVFAGLVQGLPEIAVLSGVADADTRFDGAGLGESSQSTSLGAALARPSDALYRLLHRLQHVPTSPSADPEARYFGLGPVRDVQIYRGTAIPVVPGALRFPPDVATSDDLPRDNGCVVRTRHLPSGGWTVHVEPIDYPEPAGLLSGVHALDADVGLSWPPAAGVLSWLEQGAAGRERPMRTYFVLDVESVELRVPWSSRYGLEARDVLVGGLFGATSLVVPDPYADSSLEFCRDERAVVRRLMPAIQSVDWTGKRPDNVARFLRGSSSGAALVRTEFYNHLVPAASAALEAESAAIEAAQPGVAHWPYAHVDALSSSPQLNGALYAGHGANVGCVGVPRSGGDDEAVVAHCLRETPQGISGYSSAVDLRPLDANVTGRARSVAVAADPDVEVRVLGAGSAAVRTEIFAAETVLWDDFVGLTNETLTADGVRVVMIDLVAYNAVLVEWLDSVAPSVAFSSENEFVPALQGLGGYLPDGTDVDIALGPARASIEPLSATTLRVVFSGASATFQATESVAPYWRSTDSEPTEHVRLNGTVWFDVEVASTRGDWGALAASVRGGAPIAGSSGGVWLPEDELQFAAFFDALGRQHAAELGVLLGESCPPGTRCIDGRCRCDAVTIWCDGPVAGTDEHCRPDDATQIPAAMCRECVGASDIDFAGLGVLFPFDQVGWLATGDDLIEELQLDALTDTLTPRVAAVGAVAIDELLRSLTAPGGFAPDELDGELVPAGSVIELAGLSEVLDEPDGNDVRVDVGAGVLRFNTVAQPAFQDCREDWQCVCDPINDAWCTTNAMVCDGGPGRCVERR